LERQTPIAETTDRDGSAKNGVTHVENTQVGLALADREAPWPPEPKKSLRERVASRRHLAVPVG